MTNEEIEKRAHTIYKDKDGKMISCKYIDGDGSHKIFTIKGENKNAKVDKKNTVSS